MRADWAVAVLAALFGSTAADAAEPDGYVGASVGRSRLQADYAADGLTASLDEQQTGYKVYGGVRFGVLGLEGGYVDFGRPDVAPDGTEVEVHASGFEAFATLNLKLGPATLFAKGGALNWTADVKLDGFSADESGTTGALGGGASLQLAEHLAARVDYERFLSGNSTEFHLWSAGLELTF